jgi:hypothetical protein
MVELFYLETVMKPAGVFSCRFHLRTLMEHPENGTTPNPLLEKRRGL